MNVLEFKEYLDKEYLFYKVIDYFLATLILSVGLFFMYELLLSSWSNNLGLGLFLATLTFSIYCIYFGAVGFFRISYVTDVHVIINNSGKENNETRIHDLSTKFNFFIYPYEIKDIIIKFDTQKILMGNKEVFFYYDDKGIYFNVQHKNFRDPKYGYYYTTRKLIKKIKLELTESR